MYYSLQIGRGLAALMVVLTHIAGPMSVDKYFGISIFEQIFSFGTFGVQFFFVLSGFIIYSVHKQDFSKPELFYIYLKKRIIRIYPTFLIIFLAVYSVAFFTLSESNLSSDFITTLKAMLLISSFPVPILPVAWTLEYEVFFYLLFGLLIINKKFIYVLIALLIYFNIFHFSSNESFLYVQFLSSKTIFLFLFGIIVAYFLDIQMKTSRISFILCIGLLLLFFLFCNTVLNYNLFSEYIGLLLGASFSLLIFSIVKMEKNGYDFKKYKKLNLLGNASYSLYLLHNPIIFVLAKLSVALGLVQYGVFGALITFIIMLSICIFVAIIFHLYIEIHILAFLKNKYIKTK